MSVLSLLLGTAFFKCSFFVALFCGFRIVLFCCFFYPGSVYSLIFYCDFVDSLFFTRRSERC